ncbi:enamine deaminase RidA (YjgF/YER057c/UK114 family) [Microbacterium sp. AG790]|uniref:RidA family protein n=1 Tax=Microbacterium sp. AG790 TaxID=2183995 RepID=UPI000EAF782E|nr:RidA family protein [Microbacterium sp. AG790]RKS94370.1 enamine deaminase RidA (YjgF/YER057c/UK114 family) [Microbacterium sp. AG790]
MTSELLTPRARLAELGLALPPVPVPAADYVPAVRAGGFVYTSGQLPLRDGTIVATGSVGGEVSTDAAAALARLCALNALAAIDELVGLDAVVRIVKLTGFVASAPGFVGQSLVINGASGLVREVFGAAGAHARSAIGVFALPMNAPVEVELVAEVAADL